MNSCDSSYWIFRWRMQDPNAIISATSAFIGFDGSLITSELPVASGGAGYMSGFACEAPHLKYKSVLGSNSGNLSDVSYELQRYDFKPNL